MFVSNVGAGSNEVNKNTPIASVFVINFRGNNGEKGEAGWEVDTWSIRKFEKAGKTYETSINANPKNRTCELEPLRNQNSKGKSRHNNSQTFWAQGVLVDPTITKGQKLILTTKKANGFKSRWWEAEHKWTHVNRQIWFKRSETLILLVTVATGLRHKSHEWKGEWQSRLCLVAEACSSSRREKELKKNW